MKHYLRFEVWIRRAPSVALITGVVVVLTGWGTGLLTRFSVVKTANAASQPFVSDEGRLPDLDGAAWLNSPPLSRLSLRGKVVLVNFWTYTCINSLRPLPYVKTWAAKYKDAGLVVIGVHTPEFSFEHEPMNVENAVRTLHITFPVAIDSKTRIWQAFNNQAWPAQYLVDARGRISVPPLWGRRLWRNRARHPGTPEGERSSWPGFCHDQRIRCWHRGRS
jgi:thiol-disulfide isomerase/thioredoxin